jgi:sugar lactone lactonase YvrE
MVRKPALRPVVWQPPAAPPRGEVTPRSVRVLPVGGTGPEDVLVDSTGRVLTGVADGRILRLDPVSGAVVTLGDTGGRPLGLEWLPDGALLVCDAHRGLLRLDLRSGRLDVLVRDVAGTPMRFCNNAAVAPDGTVYFTDSSRRFGIEHWRGDILEHSGTGRLLRRAPGGDVTMLLDGLQFANGVALAADGSWVAVAETGSYRVLRCWLTGERAGRAEPLVDGLAGFPDNISTGPDGLVWITLASPRNPTLDRLHALPPLLRRIAWSLPQALLPEPERSLHVIAVDATGTVVHDLHGPADAYHFVTGVREHHGAVYLGSLEESAVAILELP